MCRCRGVLQQQQEEEEGEEEEGVASCCSSWGPIYIGSLHWIRILQCTCMYWPVATSTGPYRPRPIPRDVLKIQNKEEKDHEKITRIWVVMPFP